jgi:hypothetical protein
MPANIVNSTTYSIYPGIIRISPPITPTTVINIHVYNYIGYFIGVRIPPGQILKILPPIKRIISYRAGILFPWPVLPPVFRV